MITLRRRRMLAASGAVALAATPTAAFAQAWPSRPVLIQVANIHIE
jgi:hypothetical protein